MTMCKYTLSCLISWYYSEMIICGAYLNSELLDYFSQTINLVRNFPYLIQFYLHLYQNIYKLVA